MAEPLARSYPVSYPIFAVNPPAPREVGEWGESQWQTLFALLDAVTPSIAVGAGAADDKNQLSITEAQCQEAYEQTKREVKKAPSYNKFKEYLRARPVASPQYEEHIRRLVGSLPKKAQQDLGGVLKLLNTQLGSLAMTGYRLAIKDQPIHIRQAIIQSWDNAWIQTFPTLASTFFQLGKMAFTQLDPLFRELIEYQDHNEHNESQHLAPSFNFDFIQFKSSNEPAIVDVDVVVVGSGCGGGVCAKVLAEAGHQVLVVDKGYHFPSTHFPMKPEAASQFLFESNGVITSDDRSINILAGSNWGGGGTVNWSVSLQPQGFLRQEWADRGLPFFRTQEFQHCLDRVCKFMGVGVGQIFNHSDGNRTLLEGARKLGWHAEPVPQNTAGWDHHCGKCHFGCSMGQKQGPAVSWLPAAARAGARFIEGLEVEKVLFDEKRGSKQAIGILGKWTSRDKDGGLQTPASERTQRTVHIRAKKVIISSGTLQSPLLLLRSGLRNHHIGKNLYLHPASAVRATYDRTVKGWEGGIITSVCTSFENLDGKGHGAKIEPSVMIPQIALLDHPWKNALQFKTDCLRARQMNSILSITRDRDTGRVYPDPHDGRPCVAYSPSAFDRASSLAGIVAIAKIMFIQGATEIWTSVPGVPSFKRTRPTPPVVDTTDALEAPIVDDEGTFDVGINDPDFVAWIKLIKGTGLNSTRAAWLCAHQMGTCRMSATPRDGVVDPKGKAWEADGLYVADSSVFPSASGVNPMITNMAIADYISRGISRDLKNAAGARASL
ncbi:GMC oxidoreductase [Xylariaceae sp. FL1272]|nr:GMC oxidoreductase [Xylariaceae sp. FL1272]